MGALICQECGAINSWNPQTQPEFHGYWSEQHPSATLSEVAAPTSELGAAALTYIAIGWKVFPVWWPVDGRCACPQAEACTSPAKHPMTGNGLNGASDDPKKVAHWWSVCPEANIGLPAGANGLAILDADNVASYRKLYDGLASKVRRLPATLTQITGSGKRHFVFTAPEDGIKNAANSFPGLPGIDTRGRGGYIIAAPSKHVSGGTYQWVDFFADIAPWPTSLTKMMNAAPKPKTLAFAQPPAQISDAYVAKAVANECDRILNAPRPTADRSGGRNDALNVASFNLGTLVGAGLLSEDAARRELLQAALTAGLSESEAQKTITSGLTAGMSQPRTRAAAA